tara:strand:- start:154 stop:774 length:621 start_codon:yes stop_codon:yes gene_type:complete
MQLIKTLWKKQPNLVIAGGIGIVFFSFLGVIIYLDGKPNKYLKKCNEGDMLSCYDVPPFYEKEITNPKWVSKMQKIEEKNKLEAKQKEEERKRRAESIEQEENNAIPIPVKTYRLTAQQVVDKYEISMRWDCEDAIKSQLLDRRSYKAVKVRYTPHIMNEHPDAVVDVRISFDAKNSFGGNAPSFGRCAFDSNGKMVRSPNVISGY